MNSNNRSLISIVWFILVMILVSGLDMFTSGLDAGQTSGTNQQTWDTLKQHKVPEWFKDAKFGIYAHWGELAPNE
ncbi:MAG: hypothetical protein AMJ79_00590 [Phycisphaerae bacterium SM23_30]|nr:MAG: hypothetical protein AMJ79_00590 [Phycisphaerae bacterium SM23_30]